MYVNPTFTGLTQPVVNPHQITQNFQFHCQTPDAELNNLTPSLAINIAMMFVQSLEKNNPIRVNAYNQVAVNGFVNNEFRGFVNQCVRAALVAFEANQTTSIQDIMTRYIPEWMNMFCAALAIMNPGILQMVDAGTQQSVQQLAVKYQHWIRETEGNYMATVQKMSGQGGIQGYSTQVYNPNQQPGFGTNFGGQQGMPGAAAGQMSGSSGLGVTATNMVGQLDTVAATHVGATGYYQRKLQEANVQASQVANQQQPAHHIGPDIIVTESNTSVMEGQKYESPYAKKLREQFEAEGIVQSTASGGSRWGSVAGASAPATKPGVNIPVASVSGPQPTMPTTAQAIAQKDLVGQAVSASAKDFDDAVMDFTKDPTPVTVLVPPTPESHLEKKPVIAKTQMNGIELRVVSLLGAITVDEAGWKPNKYQHYFPAWCRRTHELLFVVADTGEVVAIPTPYKPEEALKMFDYEAHGINPNMGKPAREVEIKPREEAQVLYSQDPSDVKIDVRTAHQATSTVGDLHQMALMESIPQFTKDKALQMTVVPGTNYEYLGFITPEEASGTFEQLRAIRLKVTYTSSAEAISAISSPVLRARIDKLFTERFNELLRERLGIEGYIDSYIEEAADASEMVREHMGDLLADALIEQQSEFIAQTLDVIAAEEAPDIANNFCTSEDEEDVKIFMRNSLFITANHTVLTSRFTGDELAIGVGEHASQLDADCYPVLHKAISDALNDPTIKPIRHFSVILQSIDGAKFKLLRSALNDDVFLIKAL